jgi:integrative and conjugative element protein (TIGR02256 family)
MLLWAGIRELNENVEPMAAIAVRLLGVESGVSGYDRLSWPNDVVIADVTGEFVVLLSQRALAEIRAEVRRGARVRDRSVETGGMLLGSFDEATGRAYIDTAAGPSSDSYLSALYFAHGTAGTQAIIDQNRVRSANRVGFVGMWHSHPYGPASPSPTDEAGMAWIVSPDGVGRRALMMIFGGSRDVWEAWHNGGKLPDIYVRVVSRQDSNGSWRMAPVRRGLPAGRYFRGGYFAPIDDVAANSGRRSWWLWGKRRD